MSEESRAERPAPKHPKSIQFTPIVLEAVLVVLGVALAFSLNEWREARNLHARADSALQSVYEEITGNLSSARSAFQYHSGIVDTMRQLRSSGSEPGIRDVMRVFNKGFIAPAQLLATSWDAARITGATGYMDYEDVLKVSSLYAAQDRYDRQTEIASRLIYTEMLRGGIQGIASNHANVAQIVATFAYREAELVRQFEETRSYLADRLGQATD